MKLHIRVVDRAILRQWIAHYYPHLTYNGLQQAIRAGDIRVNGAKAPPQTMLTIGDTVTIWSHLTKVDPENRRKIDLKLLEKTRIIERNSEFWVIDKPYGIPSQGGTKITVSVIDILAEMMAVDNERHRPHIVHRLDRDTTGVMIVATNSYAARDLSESLREGEWQKTYIAEVEGIVTTREGTIDDPLFGKRAITDYSVLEYVDGHTVLKLHPITGRMHQLRQHCADHLFPIVGDRKYGYKSEQDPIMQDYESLQQGKYNNRPNRLKLRCTEISFVFRGERYTYNSEE